MTWAPSFSSRWLLVSSAGVNLFESLSITFSPSQSMTWFCYATWSVIANLWTSSSRSFLVARVNFLLFLLDIFSGSILCSFFNLTPRVFLKSCKESIKIQYPNCHEPNLSFKRCSSTSKGLNIEPLHTCKCIYEIPCKNCKKTYVGEIYRISLKMPMH